MKNIFQFECQIVLYKWWYNGKHLWHKEKHIFHKYEILNKERLNFQLVFVEFNNIYKKNQAYSGWGTSLKKKEREYEKVCHKQCT
jgi:hypothetical protein